jgi:hypothetical protein
VCVPACAQTHACIRHFNLWNEWDMLLQGTEISVDTIQKFFLF